MFDGLLDYLKKHGLAVRCHEERDDVFILGSGDQHFVVKDGVVTCVRGDKLSLAKPNSLAKLLHGLKFCAQQGACIECPMRETDWVAPRKISVELYDRIGWACHGDCNSLCGRLGIMHCPLK